MRALSALAAMILSMAAALLPSQPVVVRSVVFDGNRAIDSATLKARVRMCREGAWYQPELLNSDLQNIERHYREEGYLRARVGTPDVRLVPDEEKRTGAVIRIPVTEGPLFSLGELRVNNAQAFDTATLLAMSPIRSGQPYSRRMLADWVSKVEESYRTMGFVRFQGDLKEQLRESRHTVDCVLECREGKAFQVGKITITGLPAAEAALFRRKLLVGEGGLFNPEMIPLSLHFLNSMGVYKPINMSDIEFRLDDGTGTVDITFKVELIKKPSSRGPGPGFPGGLALGFAPPPQQPADRQTVFRAEVALVNVVFSALDRNNHPTPGLKMEDFLVFEDRKPQRIEYFSQLDKGTPVPLTIALLIDTSGSVKTKLPDEKETAAEFFRTTLRRNRDLALIMSFDSDINLLQDFTDDAEKLVRSMESLRAGNSTALYDAVYLAVEEKLKTEAGRKVIVIITDGDDNSSKVRKEEAIESAQQNDVLIYGIGVKSDLRVNFGVLKKLAEETGGMFFSPRATIAEIREAFRSIGEDLQGQYSLAYTPTNKVRDGSFRTIEVRSKVSGLRIRTRKGYYAPKG